MKFKTGQVVCRNGYDDEMSVHGFVTNRGDFILNHIVEEPSVWVVCKYMKNDGSFGHEVFHQDELELSE